MTDRRWTRRQAGRQAQGPQKLSHLIAELMTRRGYARQQHASACLEVWKSVTGPAIAHASRPGKVRGGVLEVVVANSTVMQELTFQKKLIVKKLNQELHEEISDLRFRLGTVD